MSIQTKSSSLRLIQCFKILHTSNCIGEVGNCEGTADYARLHALIKMSCLYQEWYDRLLRIFGVSSTDPFLDSVISGQYGFDFKSTLFNQFMDVGIRNPEILQKLLSTKNCFEKVFLINKGFPDNHFLELLNDLKNYFKKDAEVVRKLRVKAENSNTDFKMALRYCNLAVLFAPVGSECLGQVYGTRALIFSWMQEDPLYSLKDIELALMNNCPKYIEYELSVLYKNLIDKIQNSALQERITTRMQMQKYRDKLIFKICGKQSRRIPSGFEGLNIKCNEKKGRYLTTDYEVNPGTTVIVEDPYVIILNRATRWDTDHCAKCLAKIKRTIPCESCVFVSYCSVECRFEHLMEGHQYECHCYPYLHAIRSNPTLNLCLKAICKEGPANLYKRWKQSISEQAEENRSEYIKGIDPNTGQYSSDSYEPLLHLKYQLENDTLPTLAWIAVSVIKALELNSDFFRKSEKFDNPDFKLYVASLFLLHGVSFTFNVVCLTEEVKNEDIVGHARKYGTHMDKATGIYSIISLMCHTCDPTVFRQNLPNGQIAIITNQHLYPGDELQFSYGFDYICDKLETRKEEIYNHYYFNCECIACTLEWKTYDELRYNRKFLCLFCSDLYKDAPTIQAKQCVLTNVKECDSEDNNGYCNNCKEYFELTRTMNKADKYEKILHKAHVLIIKNKPIEAIPLLIESIEFFQRRVAPPFKEMISAKMTLFEAYYLITKS